MKTCDLTISEHDEDDGPCSDPEHQAALERRRASAPAWSLLERHERSGDFRDFLDGEPIHCGAGLQLQSRIWKSDDFGDFVLMLPTGIPVRYEVEWHAGGKRPVIYVDAGGYEFTRPIELSWMRFRWPPRER